MDKETCAFIKLDPVMDLEKTIQLEVEFKKIILQGKRNIYMDFSDVQFLCPRMMRSLTKFYKTWKRAGVKIGLQDSSDYSKNTLKMTGLTKLFTLDSQELEEFNLIEDENPNSLEN